MRFIRHTAGAAFLFLVILATAACSLLTPVNPAQTTSGPPAPGSLSALTVLLREGDPDSVSCTVSYLHPEIGQPLGAVTLLRCTDGVWSLQYQYEKLNPIGSDSFTSTVSGSVSGDPAAISGALQGTYGWVWDATAGAALPTLDISETHLKTHSIGTHESSYLLVAELKTGSETAVLGQSFAEARDVQIQILFTAERVESVRLCYTEGGAEITVTALFTYT